MNELLRIAVFDADTAYVERFSFFMEQRYADYLTVLMAESKARVYEIIENQEADILLVPVSMRMEFLPCINGIRVGYLTEHDSQKAGEIYRYQTTDKTWACIQEILGEERASIPFVEFDNVTYKLLKNNTIPGILPLVSDEATGAVGYMTGEFQPLREIFPNGIARHMVSMILKSLLAAMTALDAYMIPRNALFMDLDHIYCNKKTDEISWVCSLGEETVSAAEKMHAFAAELAAVMDGAAPEKNMEKLTQIVLYAKDVKDDTIALCNELIENILLKTAEPELPRENPGQILMVNPGMTAAALGGAAASFSEAAAALRKPIAPAAPKAEMPIAEELITQEARRIREERENLELMPGMFHEEEYLGKNGFLKVLRTGERFPVISSMSIIGKSPECDFCIADNKTVSRKHAMIIREGDDYFIRDLESTNSTYLNTFRIEPNEDYLLCPGDEIILASETLVFSIE